MKKSNDHHREIPAPQQECTRYSHRPFPLYRYVPGLHAHPVAHPEGHSYNLSGEHPEAQPWLPPERWRECDDYLYGVDLYNHRYWWEAHEAWEGIWQQTDKQGQQGRFLQGLIQVSAAHLKRHVRQPDGVTRLLERSSEHLRAASDGLEPDALYMGLNIPRFQRRVDRYFGGTDSTYPEIVLPIHA